MESIERSYETLLEFLYQFPTGVMKMKKSGAIDLINPVAAQILQSIQPGFGCENGWEALALIDPMLCDIIESSTNRKGNLCDQRRCVTRSSGDTPYHLTVSIFAVDNDYLMVTLADVTTTVEQEKKRLRHHQRMSAALDNIGGYYCMLVLDLQGKVIESNSALHRMTGMDETIKGQSFDVLFDPSQEPVPLNTAHILEIVAANGWMEFECPIRQHSCGTFWGDIIVSPLSGEAGQCIGYSAVIRDITRRHHYEIQLKQLALTDQLTGLANRRRFLEVAAEEIRDMNSEETSMCLLMIDVDHFKRINDYYGHDAGDHALQELARTLQQIVRENDLAARVGGEEFLVLMPNISLEDSLACAERIRATVEQSAIEWFGRSLQLTLSIGATMLDVNTPIEGAMQEADRCLYAAKAAGRNQVVHASHF
jgi:diguanylate cyclase (GGDEF)-like protein/PAS domain S-box-containing protein